VAPWDRKMSEIHSALTGLTGFFWPHFPTQKRGANKHCAYGAVRSRLSGALVGAVAEVGAAPEALVHRLAIFEAGVGGVPVFDGRFAHAPAQEHDLLI